MIITQALLDDLTGRAQNSPRLRMAQDLRNSPEDLSQRLLNAIEPGSPIPIHRHRNTSETIVCVRGRLIVEVYDELERRCVESVELTPGGNNIAIDIPRGVWHTVHAIVPGTAIIEAKDCKYEPTGPEDILTL